MGRPAVADRLVVVVVVVLVVVAATGNTCHVSVRRPASIRIASSSRRPNSIQSKSSTYTTCTLPNLYSIHCTLYTVHCTLYTVTCTVTYTLQKSTPWSQNINILDTCNFIFYTAFYIINILVDINMFYLIFDFD